ncbi:MAG: SH3 domain-containing protein [Novosphingobium sp.]|nr:SH3 domain-containing protein [Novosphingobium sp.]
MPYWASLTADVVNMRVGPARDYKIAWVYKRKLLPLKVIRRHEGWRLAEDPDGARGWIMARFLSRKRTAIVKGATAAMRERPGGGPMMWRAEPGVVGRVGKCEAGWCKFEVDGRSAWIEATAIWGEGEP